MCEGCGLNKGLPSQKMKCDNNHELLWRPDADMFYESKGQEHKFKCRSCNLFKDEAHWHCRSCEYDICQSCGINKGQSSLCGSTKCSNNHQLSHSIARAVNLGGLILAPKCNCCGVNFSGSSYTCDQCSYYLCPDCYSFIIILQQGILYLDARLAICFVGFRELNFNVIIVLERRIRNDINAKSVILMCA